jgi:Glutaminase
VPQRPATGSGPSGSILTSPATPASTSTPQEHNGVVTTTSRLTFQSVLQRIAEEVEQIPDCGRPATYIPALAACDPRRFGMAVAELDGTVYGVGD